MRLNSLTRSEVCTDRQLHHLISLLHHQAVHEPEHQRGLDAAERLRDAVENLLMRRREGSWECACESCVLQLWGPSLDTE